MGATSRDVERQIKLTKKDLLKHDKNLDLDWEWSGSNQFRISFYLNEKQIGKTISYSGSPSNRMWQQTLIDKVRKELRCGGYEPPPTKDFRIRFLVKLGFYKKCRPMKNMELKKVKITTTNVISFLP
jgi:hypothetical protein